MKHLGDITKISGYSVPIVDCIIGGSPCQDLSVAGKRKGLDGERSGLFMEQVRIAKEMRKRDIQSGRSGVDVRPRYMVWENVPGALSSNKGEDFGIVLEELAKVNDKDAVIPRPDKWKTSGCILGDGWSIAWRVLDAQFWGVPQRRRRIALVTDFGGHSAPEILFVRKSVSGHSEPSKQTRKATPTDASGSFGADDRLGADQYNAVILGDTVSTLGVNCGMSHGRQCVLEPQTVLALDRASFNQGKNAQYDFEISDKGVNSPLVAKGPSAVCYSFDPTASRDAGDYILDGVANPLLNGTCPGHKNAVCYSVDQGGGKSSVDVREDKAPTLTTTHDGAPAGAYSVDCRNGTEDTINGALQSNSAHSLNGNNVVRTRYIVRRLTPLECERLQGYPDGWTDIGEYIDSTGKKRQASDAARYKALGNSIALPPWKWVLKRLCACYERDATMASLFDGIGGFPLLWEQINGKGSCLFSSEVEEFCIAVTKRRINNE